MARRPIPNTEPGPLRIGLVIAMPREVPPLFAAPRAGAISIYSVERGAVGLVVCGVGLKRARAAALRLCREFQPDYLLSLGACGGVRDGLAVGDLVIADEVVYHQDRIAVAGPHTTEAVERAHRSGKMPDVRGGSARPAGSSVHVGAVQTFDGPCLSRRGVSGDVLGADMECYAVVEAAREHGLPVLVVKAVSDMVPPRATPRTVGAWLWRFRSGFAAAQGSLARFAEVYFDRSGL